jgi:Cys-rich repeat protein
MTRKDAYWLAVALAVTPVVSQGCSGDDSKTTSAGGAGGSTATGGAGGASGGTGGATGGAGGATGGASGTGGSAGSAGSGKGGAGPADAGMLPDGRVTCGASLCSQNPTSTNICDTATGRCVDCLTDMDCAIETLNKHCDTAPNSAGLPAYNCEECLNNSHCPMGATCMNGDCVTPCGTAMCDTGEVCDAANNRCIDCLSDMDCADETTDKRCDLRPNAMGLPTGSCEECTESSHCPTGEVCFEDNCEPACTSDMACATDSGTPRYCHPTNKVCSECVTDANCPTTQPRCTTGGSCEECITDAHCTNPMQPYCDDNDCVQCRTTADCPAGQTCNNQGTCTTPMDGGRGGG